MRTTGTTTLALLAALALAPSAASAAADDPQLPDVAPTTDNPSHPLGDAQAARKAVAIQEKLNGRTKGRTHQVARGQYVELERLGEDRIWTVVGEFGDAVNATYGGTAGPLRNQIPEPDRAVDNVTIWAPDFSRAYYEALLFSDAPGDVSMRNFYKELSANRYTVNGEVTDWVKVPFNEANYGANYCGGIVCARTWLFVRDAVNAWYNAQIAAGRTPAEIDAYLAQYDVWDRYDHDGDGNFNEPDGYIDHFQAIHAGEGEETGGGAQGTDAIWSHRWYAFYNNIGATGPAFNRAGGIRIGNSSYWIGDYTVEPENGGVGVFAHEFGHDLGLPDLYDTSGNTGGAENSTGFWTLYSVGSYGASGRPEDGLGTKPIHMSAYEKIFLGWSNYQVVRAGQYASLKLGAAEANTKQAQTLVVLLPDKVVERNVGAPYAGTYFYYSGSGNDLDSSMTRQVTLPAGSASLTAKVRFDIELDWDYAYLTVNGAPVQTNLSTSTSPNGQNFGNGITGSTGGAWVDLTADLSAWAGQTVTLGFRYWTDVAESRPGFFVDDIAVSGQAVDGGEAEAGWTYHGFVRTNGTLAAPYFNAYFAEYRQYRGYDQSLATGPYTFGYLNDPALQNWVDHFPYQDGLLVWYYDTSFANNNVGDACASGRCGGLFLPVDAHPGLVLRPDNGKAWRPRFQAYDSTFGLEPTDVVCLHANSQEGCFGGLAGNPLFDDTQSYWVPPDPSLNHYGWSSVIVPNTGTTIRVVGTSAQGDFMQVVVAPKR
ncbi:M6 family metalloprotease domain-containing protein [Anaeromyxobacter dehalogenans]|uniref:Peptidase M6, immune inhibitor A n=1 Tax=Anaeromyxobacter dehalogenans (strain 2CP-C) TaxID=290397 RepID=Q2IMR9_ANADE|nr:M6 family metalloprotease domain-containing protein [Anaeromyxobacter dehalogenans]ABC80098.1 peptidase M6, immune inhibitor A [Anaeromyxobacter dehalogenans 2CP-C]